jgi:hypothetical protein
MGSSTPAVGILVNHRLYEGISRHETRHEHLLFYEEAALTYGLHVYYFRLQDVDLMNLRVNAYVRQCGCYNRMWLKMPQVVHNRAIHTDHESFLTLEAWQRNGIHIFNLWNRYNKWYIHQLLMKNKALHCYLPDTQPATVNTIRNMQKKYASLIIKPNKSSVGRGIMKFEHRAKKRWRLTYPQTLLLSNRKWKVIDSLHHCPVILRRRIRKQAYIVQQCIPLATVSLRPFDIRVSVQRGRTGEWDITGMVARWAAHKRFLTNVGQGGTAYCLPKILRIHQRFDVDEVISSIEQCARAIVNQLSNELPHLADLGLDIGICEDGQPMFIECNGKDQRYTFEQAGLHEIWKATYTNPIGYAYHLLQSMGKL